MNRAWKGLALGVVLGAVIVGLVIGGHSSIHESACLSPSESSPHHPWGRPDGTPTANELVVHHDYELSQNTTTKFADWVAYRLDGSTFPGDDRSRNYRLNPCLNRSEQVSDANFDGAHGKYGYDRGHLAPLATFQASEHWDEVNFMTNIAPMHQTLNRGVWAQLEAAIRQAVEPDDPLYVLTGAVYDESMPELPNARTEHRVPSDYWKIVATGDPDDATSFHATAFLFDQHGCVVEESCTFNSQFRGNRVPVDEVEDLTGFDVFPELPDEREATVEGKVGAWPPGPSNGDTANVEITKLLADAEGQEPANEWFEVCNQAAEPVGISGWAVSDEEGSYRFPDGTELARKDVYGSCVKVPGTEYNPSGDDSELALANSGETLILRNGQGNEVYRCAYDAAEEGEVVDCDG